MYHVMVDSIQWIIFCEANSSVLFFYLLINDLIEFLVFLCSIMPVIVMTVRLLICQKIEKKKKVMWCRCRCQREIWIGMAHVHYIQIDIGFVYGMLLIIMWLLLQRIKKNRDPRWEDEFQFVVEQPPTHDKLHVEVVSTSSRSLLHQKVYNS